MALRPAAQLRRLRRERAAFVHILGMPQTRFPYRQRLRQAIARRDRLIARLDNPEVRAWTTR